MSDKGKRDGRQDALREAYQGVRPLSGGKRLAVPESAPRPKTTAEKGARTVEEQASDADARAQLHGFVARGVTFNVDRDEDGRAVAYRADHGPHLLRQLGDRNAARATVDLHGLSADDAVKDLVDALRSAQARGTRVLLVIHGKGLHSGTEGPVLRDRVIHAMLEGRASPLVLALRTAPPDQGGLGATLVLVAKK